MIFFAERSYKHAGFNARDKRGFYVCATKLLLHISTHMKAKVRRQKSQTTK